MSQEVEAWNLLHDKVAALEARIASLEARLSREYLAHAWDAAFGVHKKGEMCFVRKASDDLFFKDFCEEMAKGES